MTREYILKKVTYGGTTTTEEHSNLRKTKSKAWKWVNLQKQIIREKTKGERDYGELHAEILMWNNVDDDSKRFTQPTVVAYYN